MQRVKRTAVVRQSGVEDVDVHAPTEVATRFPFHRPHDMDNVLCPPTTEVEEEEVMDDDGAPVPQAVVVVIPSPRQRPAEDTGAKDDILSCVEELAHRKPKPVIGSRRIQPWAPPASSLPSTFFDNSADDVIKFRRSVSPSHSSANGGSADESSDASSNSRTSDAALRRRRRRRIDRDFDNATAYNAEKERQEEEEQEENDSEDNEDEYDREAIDDSQTSSSQSAGEEEEDEEECPGPQPEARALGFGAGRVTHPKATPSSAAAPLKHEKTARAHYSGLTFESYYPGGSSCYHTLVGLNAAQTIQGPCAIYGIYGETACQGFLLGKKYRILENKQSRIVLQPFPKMSTAASQLSQEEYEAQKAKRAASDMEYVQSRHISLPSLCSPVWTTQQTSASDAALSADPEALFGPIDWNWVSETLRSWLDRLSANRTMSVVLVVQAYTPGAAMTRYVTFQKRNEGFVDRYGSSGGMSVPRFFSRHNLPIPFELPLQGSIKRIISSTNSVAVVGGQNIGKSTLARAVANAWVSQYGCCYWLDVDLGRPEFGVGGSYSVSRINRPLTKENDFSAATVVKLVHVGGARVNCPESVSWALCEVCEFVAQHQDTWLRPLIVNTHGWIQSTGRRATVEVIRRLKIENIVQLMRHGDPKWVVPEVIFDTTQGLNKRTVGERFAAGIPLLMADAEEQQQQVAAAKRGGGGTDKYPPLHVHSLTVVRLELNDRKSRFMRQDNWRWVFRSVLPEQERKKNKYKQMQREERSQAALGSPRSSRFVQLRIPLVQGADTIFVVPTDPLDFVSMNRFIGMVAHCVVAIGMVRGPTTAQSRKRDRDDDEMTTASFEVIRLQQLLSRGKDTVSFLGYGFVVSSAAEAMKDRAITIAVPVSLDVLRSSSLTDQSGAGMVLRPFVLACPYDLGDTQFIKREFRFE